MLWLIFTAAFSNIFAVGMTSRGDANEGNGMESGRKAEAEEKDMMMRKGSSKQLHGRMEGRVGRTGSVCRESSGPGSANQRRLGLEVQALKSTSQHAAIGFEPSREHAVWYIEPERQSFRQSNSYVSPATRELSILC